LAEGELEIFMDIGLEASGVNPGPWEMPGGVMGAALGPPILAASGNCILLIIVKSNVIVNLRIRPFNPWLKCIVSFALLIIYKSRILITK